MRYCYADPPYLGMGKLYPEHPEAKKWDDAAAHVDLMNSLTDEFDGWAMSLSVPSLRVLLPHAPEVRIGAWVKPFAVFKPNVNPGYCWEPVLFWNCRSKRARTEPTVRDFTWPAEEAVAVNITLKKGVVGAKPPQFCNWVFDMLGIEPEDEFVDLFPGSGSVTEAFRKWRREKVRQRYTEGAS